MTPYPNLMVFWGVCISWSALFLTAVSTYLYVDSRKSRERSAHATSRFVRDFVFVWVLLGLLGLYIVSIDRASSIVFASGNVVVEALLIAYTVKNRPREGLELERRTWASENERRIHEPTPNSP
jgi:hypothetical protein